MAEINKLKNEQLKSHSSKIENFLENEMRTVCSSPPTALSPRK